MSEERKWQVRLPEELHQKLEVKREQSGKEKSELLIEAIQVFLESEEKMSLDWEEQLRKFQMEFRKGFEEDMNQLCKILIREQEATIKNCAQRSPQESRNGSDGTEQNTQFAVEIASRYGVLLDRLEKLKKEIGEWIAEQKGFNNTITEKLNDQKSSTENQVSSVYEEVTGLKKDMVKIGKNLGEGLTNGFKSVGLRVDSTLTQTKKMGEGLEQIEEKVGVSTRQLAGKMEKQSRSIDTAVFIAFLVFAVLLVTSFLVTDWLAEKRLNRIKTEVQLIEEGRFLREYFEDNQELSDLINQHLELLSKKKRFGELNHDEQEQEKKLREHIKAQMIPCLEKSKKEKSR